MRRFLNKLILTWLLLWMPVAATIAATMPIYARANTSMEADAPASAASLPPCHQADESAPVSDDTACGHCVLCHIANSIIPPTIAAFTATDSHGSPHETEAVSFVSFFPALLQRPPSSSGR